MSVANTGMTPKQRARAILNGIMFLVAAGYFHQAGQLPFGQLARPGPGIWPYVVSIAAMVIAAIGLLESLLKHEDGKTAHVELPTGVDRRRAGAFGVLMVVYMLSLQWLGFLLPSFVVVLLTMRLLDREPWWRATLISAIGVGVVYWSFVNLFETRFPTGELLEKIGF